MQATLHHFVQVLARWLVVVVPMVVIAAAHPGGLPVHVLVCVLVG